MAHIEISARPPPGYPPQKGGWTLNRLGRRLKTRYLIDNLDPGSSDIIILPSYLALQKVKLSSKAGKRSQLSGASGDAPISICSDQRCRLLELPTEILLYILRFLLPVGHVFHFSPTEMDKVRLVSVHWLSRLGTANPGTSENRLALVPTIGRLCHQLMDIAYAIFLGESQFIFELATVGLTSVVHGADDGLDSWSKIVHMKPDGIAPFGSIAARDLTSLSLSISLPSQLPSRDDWTQLEQYVGRIAQTFDGSDHSLRHLAVWVGFASRTKKRVISHNLHVDSSKRLQIVFPTCHGERYKRPTVRTTEKLAKLIEPLLRIQGLNEIKISGAITPEEIRVLEESGSESRKREFGSVDTEIPSKKEAKIRVD